MKTKNIIPTISEINARIRSVGIIGLQDVTHELAKCIWTRLREDAGEVPTLSQTQTALIYAPAGHGKELLSQGFALAMSEFCGMQRIDLHVGKTGGTGAQVLSEVAEVGEAPTLFVVSEAGEINRNPLLAADLKRFFDANEKPRCEFRRAHGKGELQVTYDSRNHFWLCLSAEEIRDAGVRSGDNKDKRQMESRFCRAIGVPLRVGHYSPAEAAELMAFYAGQYLHYVPAAEALTYIAERSLCVPRNLKAWVQSLRGREAPIATLEDAREYCRANKLFPKGLSAKQVAALMHLHKRGATRSTGIMELATSIFETSDSALASKQMRDLLVLLPLAASATGTRWTIAPEGSKYVEALIVAAKENATKAPVAAPAAPAAPKVAAAKPKAHSIPVTEKTGKTLKKGEFSKLSPEEKRKALAE